MTYINGYVLKLMEEAIADEIHDYSLYTTLAQKCPEYGPLLESIAADEIKHKKMLLELYSDLTGKDPMVKETGEADSYGDCKELISARVPAELEGAALYRTIYFTMPDVAAKNILFELMTDEMYHATLLSNIK